MWSKHDKTEIHGASAKNQQHFFVFWGRGRRFVKYWPHTLFANSVLCGPDFRKAKGG